MISTQSESLESVASEIDQLLEASGNELIHYSSKYLTFISRVVGDADLICLTARSGLGLEGFIPLVFKTDPVLGTVANSLPYFGSHGGLFVSSQCADTEGVSRALVAGMKALCEAKGVASVTVVENLFRPVDESVYAAAGLTCVDDRVGQLTHLPGRECADAGAELMASFHVKTRNAVRKGQKFFGLLVERKDESAVNWMHSVHASSILSMGGVPKSVEHFKVLLETFGEQARIYICENDGVPVAGVLVLLYGQTVEYFTPVVEDASKDKQLLSALIFRVMLALSEEDYRLWNWGGTWRSQEGVYRFKSRWGAFDKDYRYFNAVMDTNLLSVERSALFSAFPYFYLFRY